MLGLNLAVRLRETRPLAAFGRISYGFHLYHLAVPLLLDSAWYRHGLALLHVTMPGPDGRAVLVFMLTLGLARLSFVLVEMPIMRLGRDAGMRIKSRASLQLWYAARPIK
ncbi:hypothetical protein [Massilia aerilata]|uniref:Acyltransferase 3 domain-containing protein n=1 Tax=Massilia aerilata TaxID=453817 RepID=A0ABW0RU11_9BURK